MATPEHAPPGNVRLILRDGTVVPCTVIMDPEPDPHGLAVYYAVPGPLPDGAVLSELRADSLPPQSVLRLDAGWLG